MSGCAAAMDVLTSAASAHEAAETHSSGGASKISSEAQILALKRKLIECDQESREQRERIAGLEKALEIEKREHQLTTSKLTMLLNKRRASDAQCAATAHTHQRRHRSHAPEPPPLTRTRSLPSRTRTRSLPSRTRTRSLPSPRRRVCLALTPTTRGL